MVESGGKVLRRVIRLGSSYAISIPPAFMQDLGEYVWVIREENSIKILKARVS